MSSFQTKYLLEINNLFFRLSLSLSSLAPSQWHISGKCYLFYFRPTNKHRSWISTRNRSWRKTERELSSQFHVKYLQLSIFRCVYIEFCFGRNFFRTILCYGTRTEYVFKLKIDFVFRSMKIVLLIIYYDCWMDKLKNGQSSLNFGKINLEGINNSIMLSLKVLIQQ